MHTFDLKNIEQALATAAHDVVTGARAIASESTKLEAAEPAIEGVTALIDPTAVVVERAAFAALAALAKAANDTSDAGAANGLNVQLDQETIEDFRQLYSTLMNLAKDKNPQRITAEPVAAAS